MPTCGFPNNAEPPARAGPLWPCCSPARVAATPAHAAGTPAGTVINNSATATYDLPGGGTNSVTSNTVSLTVDELLDVGVAWTDGGDVTVTPGATGQLLTFRVTNAGNGDEAFRADRARQCRRRRFRSERDLDRPR